MKKRRSEYRGYERGQTGTGVVFDFRGRRNYNKIMKAQRGKKICKEAP
ncbi:hypothetical protein HMPREF1508_0221 [Shuttleworthella sp. MSX8B]|nr:hypothetical protein HMPREF1508_0221 [Shuttleworthia sp. MSX8B]